VFELIVDTLFMIDVAMNFNFAYEDAAGAIIVSRRAIACHYAGTWFLPDLAGSLPIALIVDRGALFANFRLLRMPRLLRLLRMARFVKVMRAFHLEVYLRRIQATFDIHPASLRILKFVWWFLVITHWIACFWWFTAALDGFGPQTWVARYGYAPEAGTGDDNYLACVYWALQTAGTVGFGDLLAVTVAERVFTIVVVCCGLTWFAYITATIASYLEGMDAQSKARREKAEAVETFMASRGLRRPLRARVRDYYALAWRKRTSAADAEILDELSTHLQTDVIFELHRAVIPKMAFFKDKDPHFVAGLLRKAFPLQFGEGEIVSKEGATGHHLYLLVVGRVEMVTLDNVACLQLPSGSLFGEIALLCTTKQVVSVRAVTFVELLAVHRTDLEAVLGDYPEYEAELVALAVERLRRIRDRRLRKGAAPGAGAGAVGTSLSVAAGAGLGPPYAAADSDTQQPAPLAPRLAPLAPASATLPAAAGPASAAKPSRGLRLRLPTLTMFKAAGARGVSASQVVPAPAAEGARPALEMTGITGASGGRMRNNASPEPTSGAASDPPARSVSRRWRWGGASRNGLGDEGAQSLASPTGTNVAGRTGFRSPISRRGSSGNAAPVALVPYGRIHPASMAAIANLTHSAIEAALAAADAAVAANGALAPGAPLRVPGPTSGFFNRRWSVAPIPGAHPTDAAAGTEASPPVSGAAADTSGGPVGVHPLVSPRRNSLLGRNAHRVAMLTSMGTPAAAAAGGPPAGLDATLSPAAIAVGSVDSPATPLAGAGVPRIYNAAEAARLGRAPRHATPLPGHSAATAPTDTGGVPLAGVHSPPGRLTRQATISRHMDQSGRTTELIDLSLATVDALIQHADDGQAPAGTAVSRGGQTAGHADVCAPEHAASGAGATAAAPGAAGDLLVASMFADPSAAGGNASVPADVAVALTAALAGVLARLDEVQAAVTRLQPQTERFGP
jgi:CRP-like cAMP-binding protein